MKVSWPPSPSLSKADPETGAESVVLSLGRPVLFHWAALAVVVALLPVSALLHMTALLALSAFILAAAAVCWLWSRQSMRQVLCCFSPGRSRVFCGETVDITLQVTNRKQMFLPWLNIELELPSRLATGDLRTPSRYMKERPRWATAVGGGAQLTWKHSFECKARGAYRLGPVRLRSGDILGIFPREMVMPRFEQLLVYPRIVPVDSIAIPLRELTGERTAPLRLFEDVSQTMGARDYRSEDAFKRIHWKASARYGQLQTKQYESTTRLSLLLALDAYSFCQQAQRRNEEDFELALTIAASMAYQAQRDRYSVGLIANSAPAIELPVHADRGQLTLILEALARAKRKSEIPLHQHFSKNRGYLSLGTTLAIITNGLAPLLAGFAYRLHRQGFPVLVVSIGDQTPAAIPSGLHVIPARSASDLTGR